MAVITVCLKESYTKETQLSDCDLLKGVSTILIRFYVVKQSCRVANTDNSTLIADGFHGSVLEFTFS